MSHITLLPFNEERLRAVWQVGYREAAPEWSRWDAPYFEEYQAYATAEDFAAGPVADFLRSDRVRALVVEGQTIGMVSRHWLDQRTRWMEVGILIYDPTYWSGGLGRQALARWTTETFADFPELQHLGLTTWSGNGRMIRCAQRLGWQEEARIRQVRYWQGTYYNSVKYGILRQEWATVAAQDTPREG